MRDRRNMVFSLAVLAVCALATGDDARAGWLWGAIEIEEARAPLGAWQAYRHEFADVLLADPSPQLDRGREAGRRLTLEEASRRALALVADLPTAL